MLGLFGFQIARVREQSVETLKAQLAEVKAQVEEVERDVDADMEETTPVAVGLSITNCATLTLPP